MKELLDTGVITKTLAAEVLTSLSEEIDAMDWMLTHPLSSKNLSAGEKLAMTEEFKKEVALDNEKKKSEAGKEFGNGKNSSSPNGEKLNVHTDKELAKMAGVGTGTVARFNKVMNSDDEELKKKVLANEVSINAGIIM